MTPDSGVIFSGLRWWQHT